MIPPAVLQALAAVPGLKKGRCDAPEPEPVAPVDVYVVEQTIPLMLPVTADMVRLQLLTGARPGEVCSLRPCDIDRSGDIWEHSVDGHKTEHHGRSRTVYIGPAAQALLRPYLLRDELSHCFSPREAMDQHRAQRYERRTTPLSCGNRPGTNRKRQSRKKAGDRYDTSSYRHAIHYACDRAFPPPGELAKQEGETTKQHMARLTEDERAALDAWQKEHRWSPNKLRHTKATEIRRRFGLEAAQVILGHAAADVTQIYAERDAEKASEVARLVG